MFSPRPNSTPRAGSLHAGAPAGRPFEPRLGGAAGDGSSSCWRCRMPICRAGIEDGMQSMFGRVRRSKTAARSIRWPPTLALSHAQEPRSTGWRGRARLPADRRAGPQSRYPRRRRSWSMRSAKHPDDPGSPAALSAYARPLPGHFCAHRRGQRPQPVIAVRLYPGAARTQLRFECLERAIAAPLVLHARRSADRQRRLGGFRLRRLREQIRR